MTEAYTTTRNGAIGVPGGRYGDAIELPVTVGRGTVRRLAQDVADQIIVAARTSGDDPIAWVTSNAMVPPLRWFARAEHVWQAANNDDGELWAWFGELTEQHVADANVALECPEYDNMLYAVDLTRFEYAENPDGETLQGDWQPVTLETRLRNAGYSASLDLLLEGESGLTGTDAANIVIGLLPPHIQAVLRDPYPG